MISVIRNVFCFLYLCGYFYIHFIAIDSKGISDEGYTNIYLANLFVIAIIYAFTKQFGKQNGGFNFTGVAAVTFACWIIYYSWFHEDGFIAVRTGFAMLVLYAGLIYALCGTLEPSVVYRQGGFLDRHKGISLAFFYLTAIWLVCSVMIMLSGLLAGFNK